MADSLEAFLNTQGKKYGMDINQIIEHHKEFVNLKKICLQTYHEKKIEIDGNIYNCLEKAKHASKLLEKTMNKIY
jgi:hypothetical protein